MCLGTSEGRLRCLGVISRQELTPKSSGVLADASRVLAMRASASSQIIWEGAD